MRPIPINVVEGNVAPRYDTGCEAKLSHVTITEQGTQAHLPIVDFVATLPSGEQVVIVLSGREVCAIAGAIRGVNTRVHGTPEP